LGAIGRYVPACALLAPGLLAMLRFHYAKLLWHDGHACCLFYKRLGRGRTAYSGARSRTFRIPLASLLASSGSSPMATLSASPRFAERPPIALGNDRRTVLLGHARPLGPDHIVVGQSFSLSLA
jgi:hypothetical protein